MTPPSIRPVDDALLIEGPQGSVLIRRQADGIEMQYQGDQLANGSSLAYSKELFEQAIEYANRFPFPWRIDADGTQRITDHKRFYEQTFNPDLQGVETLRRWLQSTKKNLKKKNLKDTHIFKSPQRINLNCF